MYRRDRLHPESDLPNANLLQPHPNRNTWNELMRICFQISHDNTWFQPALIASGFPMRGYENTAPPQENSTVRIWRNRLPNRKFNPPLKNAADDACRIRRIIPSRWCVLVLRGPFGFTKSGKCGLSASPIGILGGRPNKRRPGENPPKCCTWDPKCIIFIDGNPPHSTCVGKLAFRFPTIWSTVVRKWPCLRSAAPRIWRFPDITVCDALLRGDQKSRKTPI